MSPVRPASRHILSVLLLLAVAAVLLQGASVPHTHAPSKPGLYNLDHDRVLLATLHGAAVLTEASAPLVLVLLEPVALLAIRSRCTTAHPTCDSRAPPRA